jgi:hypothetical protein
MKYLRSRKKGNKIKLKAKWEIAVPMFCVVEIEERPRGGVVKIKSLTGQEMDYGGLKLESGGVLVEKKYVEEMLANKRKFIISDNFNFISIR